MYEKRLNGILADEMGLGKTIQTIALLAHLACEKGWYVKYCLYRSVSFHTDNAVTCSENVQMLVMSPFLSVFSKKKV